MNFHTSYAFSLQNFDHCMSFFDACGKQSGHFDAINGERQLNDEGQINNYNNGEFLWLFPVPMSQVHCHVLFGSLERWIIKCIHF
jgi:hypothetical protein